MSLIAAGGAHRGSVRGFYPKTIEGSLRFNDDDSAYLSWTPASAGNRKTWTWSGWVKRGNLPTTTRVPFFGAGSGTPFLYVEFVASGSGGATGNELRITQFNGSSDDFNVTTDALYRDPSAWYHIVFAVDTTQATASNRIKVYVNGSQITAFHSSSYPSQNFDTEVNTAEPHNLGKATGIVNYFDGYLAEVHFTDGTAYDADAFGELKNGVWVAKTPDVTYGTNGFYLDFQDDTEVEAFNTVLYNGTNGVGGSVTGVGFKPDLIWVKSRSAVRSHVISDSVRGTNANLFPDLTNAESTASTGIQSFDSDGFTYGTTAPLSDGSLVAWCWKAGDSNVSNTDGSITSTVRANDTYGFSIVSYTGTGSSGTIGHGLSTAPAMIITKNRENGNQEWTTYHKDLPAGYVLFLESTSSQSNRPQDYTTTAPTTSVYSVGGGNPTSGLTDDYIAYCWAEKTGYSKFGTYSGDSTTDGSNSITCGFKPAWVMIKRYDSGSAERWNIFDNTRSITNPADDYLAADSSNAESVDHPSIRINFEENGFSLAGNNSGVNQTGGDYIYAAFADTREAAFWLDQSGNDNDWQPVNLDHNDTVADSPTDNFATWNPLFRGGEKSASIAATTTLSDGNLKASVPTNSYMGATMRPTSGQWYCEATIDTVTLEIGWGWLQATEYSATTAHAGQANKWGAEYSGYAPADIFLRDETTAIAQPTITLANGDVIQWAWDIDNGKGWLGVNNSWYDSSGGTTGNPATGSNPTFTFTADEAENLQVYVANGTGTAVFTANFGQQPFKYDPPA